jgi:type VI secretion system secreted protein Hcp
MPIYMKYGDIVGDVSETNHENWIELTSFSWGVARTASNAPGSSTGRALSAPRVSDVQVAKDEDVATIPMFRASLLGTPCAVTIDFARTGSDGLQAYYTVKLEQAVVTSFAQSSGGDRPSEAITINFTKVTVSGSQMDADGSSITPTSYGWDVQGNAPI